MTNWLDAYHFHEREWEDYETLRGEFEWEVPERFNVADYVCNRWADDKGRVAIFYEDVDGHTDTFTYWRMHSITNQLAHYLRSQGVERGDRVAINAPQRSETVFSHIACWKLGAVSVPMSTLFGPDAIDYRLNDCDAVVGIVDRSNVSTFREVYDTATNLRRIITIGDVNRHPPERDFWDVIQDQPRRFDSVSTRAEDDSTLIYTSGTTGNPKGVLHAHRALLGHLPLVLTSFCNLEVGDTDVFWTPSEWAWIASLYDVVLPGLFYGRPVVAYNRREFDADVSFGVIERYGVSLFFAPPTALRMMMQVENPERYDVDSIRTVSAGGESLGRSLVEWAADTFDGAVVHEGYGQTEANMLVGDCRKLLPFKEGYIGKPAPGHDVRIVDPETAEPIDEPGEIGEIAVRYEGNPVCFKEYLNNPKATERKVRNGWLLTEDLGKMDEEGYVAFQSRKDDVIISAGYRIGPMEIEETVSDHDAVVDAGVIGVPDEERGEVPKAFVVLSDRYEPSGELRDELRSHVRERLAQYEYPREIEFVDELPKTSTGKVRRASLREP